MPYCIHCGNHNPDSAKFCSQCGKTIANNDANPSSQSQVRQVQQNTQAESYAHAALSRNQNPVATTTTYRPSGNQNFRSPALYGSLLVLIGFFLPWFPNYSYYYNSPTINGTGFVKSFIAAMNQQDDAAKAIGTIFTILIYLIPICAGLFFINAILSSRISGLVRLMRYIPFLVFLLFVILIIIASTAQGVSPSFIGFRIGIYMCMVGSVVMLSMRRTF